MSNAVIQARYDTLATVAAHFGRQEEVCRVLGRQIRAAHDALAAGAWLGEGAEAFFAEMDGQVLPALERLAAAFVAGRETTLALSAALRTAEENAAAPFRGGAAADAGRAGVEAEQGEGCTEWLHGLLDLAGIAPGVGIIADGANALIYLVEGRRVEAGIAAISMVPLFGDAVGAGKLGLRVGRAAAEQAGEVAVRRAARRVGFFGELAANSRYVANGYEYLTNGFGRVKRASGRIRLGDGLRTKHQTKVGKMGLDSDVGGHLFARMFGGSPEGFNLVPQNGTLNNGRWKKLENVWAKAVQDGEAVKVQIDVLYPSGSGRRPAGFDVDYTIGRERFTQHFVNRRR